MGASFLYSCKEVLPTRPVVTLAVDSTYVASTIPEAEPHNVLFEDFTGASCSNCPGAKENYLDPLVRANPGRINVVSLHVDDFSQANPVAGSKHDFRTSMATAIEHTVYLNNLYAMPIAGVDRMPFGVDVQGSRFQILKENWGSSVATQLAVKDSLNLDVTSNYNSVTDSVYIQVKVTYLYPTSTVHFLSVVICEDSIIDKQLHGLEEDTAYKFDDVLRAFVTSVPYGDQILSPSLTPAFPAKEAGRVYIRRYAYKLDSKWVLRHLKVTAFVHKDIAANASMVQQSKQIPLVQ